MTEAVSVPRVRRGLRLGLWSLVSAVVANLWFFSGIALALWSISGGPFELLFVALGLYFLGLVIVPGAAITAFVLAVFALLRNTRAGIVMAIVALALCAMAVLAVAVVLPGFDQLPY